MTRHLSLIVGLVIMASAVPAYGQTRVTFLVGDGAARGALDESGTFDARAAGIEFHLKGSAWIGTEIGVISGTGHGYGTSDAFLAVPINLYGYLAHSTAVKPFLTIGYTSIDILGAGADLGAGFDLVLSRRIAIRFEVRGLAVFDKSGIDQFGMLRISGVIAVSR